MNSIINTLTRANIGRYKLSLTAGSAEARGVPSTPDHLRLRMCTYWSMSKSDVDAFVGHMSELCAALNWIKRYCDFRSWTDVIAVERSFVGHMSELCAVLNWTKTQHVCAHVVVIKITMMLTALLQAHSRAPIKFKLRNLCQLHDTPSESHSLGSCPV